MAVTEVSKVRFRLTYAVTREELHTFARMKHFGIIALVWMLSLSACETDFNVTTDWEDITVVYGLLDASDTAQYIKVNKAFLDPNTNALQIAQIPDSIFYDELTVELQEMNGSSVVKTIQLEKVDGNLEGYVKDTGVFAQSPNFLYKTKEVLNQERDYKLVITQPDNGKQIFSSTPIVNDFQILRPTTNIKLNLLPGFEYNVNWISAEDGKIYALTVRLHYTEFKFDDPNFSEAKSLDWVIFTSERSASTSGGSTMDFDMTGDNFYTFLSNTIATDPNIYRQMGLTDFMFSVGGETMDTYNQVTIAQQGLTSGQVLPTYTNIDNGLGLFSSRFHKTVAGVPFDNRTLDSIACYSATRDLNFLESDGTFCQQ